MIQPLPAAGHAHFQQPLSQQPVSRQPASQQPVSEQPVSEQPVSEQPVSDGRSFTQAVHDTNQQEALGPRGEARDATSPDGEDATSTAAVSGARAASGPGELTPEEQQQVAELRRSDRGVRAHEAAHLAAAGGLASGGPSFTYQTGPDGRQYAVGGEVGISASPVSGDPAATVRKMQQVRRAALAPADPSSQDRRVAAQAAQYEAAARLEAQESTERAARPTGSDSSDEDARGLQSVSESTGRPETDSPHDERASDSRADDEHTGGENARGEQAGDEHGRHESARDQHPGDERARGENPRDEQAGDSHDPPREHPFLRRAFVAPESGRQLDVSV